MKIEKSYKKNVRKKADQNLKPRLRFVQQTKYGIISKMYITEIYDKSQNKKISKTFCFGNKRTKIEAYNLLINWRKKMIKQLNKLNAD